MKSHLNRSVTAWSVLLVLLLSATVGYAQDGGEAPQLPETDTEEEFLPTYTLGDQLLSINLGLFLPLFFSGGEDAVQALGNKLTLGGTGHLRWGSFLNNNVSVGGELAGMFSFTPNRRALYMIPITARATYYFRAYPWEFPLSLAVGFNISRLEESRKVDPIVMPGAGLYWAFNNEWSFGVDARYWWVPQWYTGNEPPPSQSRYGNFSSITASVLYHF